MIVKVKETITTPQANLPSSPTERYPYTSLLPKVERGIKRDQKIHDIYFQYCDTFNQYFSNTNTVYYYMHYFLPIRDSLLAPENYFFVHDSKLCYFRYSYSPYKNNYYPQLCIFALPLSSKNPLEADFIRILSRLVSLRNNISTQDKKEFTYFIKRPLALDLYNFLLNCCILVDENLYVATDNELERLSTNYFDDSDINIEHLITPELLSFVKKHVTDKYKTVRPENNYFLYISAFESSNCHLLYASEKDSENTFSLVALTSDTISNLFPKTYTKYSDFYSRSKTNKCIMLSPQKPVCSDFIANFLYVLTNGDCNTLNNLAKLFAAMATPELPTSSPFVFLCPSNVRNNLLETLNCVFQSANKNILMYTESLAYPSLKELYSTKCISKLITIADANARAIVITDCYSNRKSLPTSHSSSSIKNLLKGKMITYVDHTLGTISYQNTLPIIFFPSNTEELNNISMISKPIILNFNHLSVETFNDANLLSNWDANSYDWLNISFTLHGLLLLANKKYSLSIPNTTSYSNNIDADNILKDFVKCCCSINSDAQCFTYASDMYNAYKAFVLKKYSIAPEKRKDMNQRIQIMYNLAYKRPHISRTQSNKYAIMGITLKDDYEEIIESFATSQTNDDTLWKETLSQIDSIVPDALYLD